MTSTSPIHNQQGFTLVELLVAIVIMTIGVLTTLSMISTAMKANTTSNRLTTKTSLAQQVAEGLLSKKIDDAIYTTSQAYPKYYDFELNNISEVVKKITIDKANYIAIFSTLVNTPAANITTITIEIKTDPPDGNPLTLTCFKRTI